MADQPTTTVNIKASTALKKTKEVLEEFAIDDLAESINLASWEHKKGTVLDVPSYVTRADFNYLLDAAAAYYKLHGRLPSLKPGELLHPDYVATPANKKQVEKWERLLLSGEWKRGLKSRGLPVPGVFDDPRKVTALSILTDPLIGGSFEAKLKRAGITPATWDLWLSEAAFREKFRALTEANFEKRQGEINLAVQSMALRPGNKQLEAAKYFNEISGRHDPNARQVMDVQNVMRGMIEILASEISDPETLERIARKIQLLAGGSGAF